MFVRYVPLHIRSLFSYATPLFLVHLKHHRRPLLLLSLHLCLLKLCHLLTAKTRELTAAHLLWSVSILLNNSVRFPVFILWMDFRNANRKFHCLTEQKNKIDLLALCMVAVETTAINNCDTFFGRWLLVFLVCRCETFSSLSPFCQWTFSPSFSLCSVPFAQNLKLSQVEYLQYASGSYLSWNCMQTFYSAISTCTSLERKVPSHNFQTKSLTSV